MDDNFPQDQPHGSRSGSEVASGSGSRSGSEVASAGDVLRSLGVVTVFLTLILSATAAMSIATTMGVHVFSITDRKRDLGLLGLYEFIPAVVLVFVSGSIADRFDRRKVIAVGLALELVAVAALVSLDYDAIRTAAPFLLIMVLMGASRSAVGPAMRALVPASVPAEQLPRAVALSSASWQMSVIVGPVIGALSYRWFGPRTAYMVAATLTVGAVVAALLIPKSIGTAHFASGERTENPSLRAAFQGLVTIARHPILLGAMALDLFAVLFGGAVALIPAVSKELLNNDPSEVGVLKALGGIGATAVTIFLAMFPLRKNIGRSLLIAVAVFGAATVLFGQSRSLWLSGLAIVILSGADSVSVFVRTTLVPLVTPAAERGRVLAVEAVFIGASNELGAFESGEVAHHFGTVTSIVSGGLLTLVVVVVWWFVFPALRRVNRFEDLEPTPGGGFPAFEG